MWSRKRKDADAEKPSEPPQRLRDALRNARVDQAERSGVVVDLHDAEVARLELLNEALDPLFEEVPKRSICSIAASAAARRRGCGSMPSPMCAWAPTNAGTGSCRRPATAARCSPNRSTSPRSSTP